MKKAQIQSQIFIYVFALLVISLILFFGIKSISSFKKDTEKVIMVNFITDLKSQVNSITSEYDSIQKVSLDLPKEYKVVCFIDKNANTPYEIVNEYSNTDNNIFILKENNMLEEEFNAGKLDIINLDDTSPNPDYLCLTNNLGKVEFMLKGKGKYSELYEVPT